MTLGPSDTRGDARLAEPYDLCTRFLMGEAMVADDASAMERGSMPNARSCSLLRSTFCSRCSSYEESSDDMPVKPDCDQDAARGHGHVCEDETIENEF